jgi:hypothetical protein
MDVCKVELQSAELMPSQAGGFGSGSEMDDIRLIMLLIAVHHS